MVEVIALDERCFIRNNFGLEAPVSIDVATNAKKKMVQWFWNVIDFLHTI